MVASTFSRLFSTPTMRFWMFVLRSRMDCSSLPKSLRISSAIRTTDASWRRILASVQLAIVVKSSWDLFFDAFDDDDVDGCWSQFAVAAVVAIDCDDCVGRDKNTGSTMRWINGIFETVARLPLALSLYRSKDDTFRKFNLWKKKKEKKWNVNETKRWTNRKDTNTHKKCNKTKRKPVIGWLNRVRRMTPFEWKLCFLFNVVNWKQLLHVVNYTTYFTVVRWKQHLK